MFKRKPRYKLKLVNDQYQLYVNNKPSNFYFKTIKDAKAFTERLINPKWKRWSNKASMHLLLRHIRENKKRNIQIIQTSINNFNSVSVPRQFTDDVLCLGIITYESHSSFSEANEYLNEYINNRFDIKPKNFIKI